MKYINLSNARIFDTEIEAENFIRENNIKDKRVIELIHHKDNIYYSPLGVGNYMIYSIYDNLYEFEKIVKNL